MAKEPSGQGIGARIKRIRQAQDMTAQELARSAGISAGYLSAVERDLSAISGEKLVRIAQALTVSVAVLVGEENPAAVALEEIRIPRALSEAAQQLGLSYQATIMLLQGRRSLVAKRSDSSTQEWDATDWIKFFHTVREYLPNEETQ